MHHCTPPQGASEGGLIPGGEKTSVSPLAASVRECFDAVGMFNGIIDRNVHTRRMPMALDNQKIALGGCGAHDPDGLIAASSIITVTTRAGCGAGRASANSRPPMINVRTRTVGWK